MVISQFLVPFEAPYLWPLRSVYRNRTIDLAAIATRDFSAIAAAKSAAIVTPRFRRNPLHYSCRDRAENRAASSPRLRSSRPRLLQLLLPPLLLSSANHHWRESSLKHSRVYSNSNQNLFSFGGNIPQAEGHETWYSFPSRTIALSFQNLNLAFTCSISDQCKSFDGLKVS